MRHSAPFSRLNAIMAVVGAAVAAAGPSPLARQGALAEALAKTGSYRSRGKGRGTPMRTFNRAAGRSRYMPHQGFQECARRARRGW